MTKFTFKIRGNIIPQKCLSIIRKYLTISSNAQSSKANKLIKAWKRPSEISVHSSSSEDEEFIPLAARDSEWVGITFYNPKFRSQAGDTENDNEHTKVVDVDAEEEPPIYTLFPALRDKLPEISSNQISTTHITKLLVGQKPKLSYLKKSKKLAPVKTQKKMAVKSRNRSKGLNHEEMKKKIKFMSDTKLVPEEQSTSPSPSTLTLPVKRTTGTDHLSTVSLPSVKESPNEERPDEKESGAEQKKPNDSKAKPDNLKKKPERKPDKVPPSSN